MRPFVFIAAIPLFAQVSVQPMSCQQPLSAFQRDKAERLLRDQLPCLGCHEVRGDGGRSAPSLTSLGARRDSAYIRAMIEDPQRFVPGTAMPTIPMAPATRELIIAYFGGSAAGRGTARPTSLQTHADSVSSVTLYRKWCASCHGTLGKGDGPNASYLPRRPAVHADKVEMGQRSDDALFDAIAGGGIVMGKSPRMPAFGQTLTSTEIRQLVRYIRTLCACNGPAWSTDDKR